jgi:hypothetical protein
MSVSNIEADKRLTIELPQAIDKAYAKEALAAILYYNGVFSEKQARSMIGKSRREFQEEIIPKFGLSMVGGTEEDVAIELMIPK